MISFLVQLLSLSESVILNSLQEPNLPQNIQIQHVVSHFHLLGNASPSISWPALAASYCPLHLVHKILVEFLSMVTMNFPLPSSYAGLLFPECHLFYLDFLLHFTISCYSISSDFPEKWCIREKWRPCTGKKCLYPTFILNQWFIWVYKFRFEIIFPQNFKGISPFLLAFSVTIESSVPIWF